MKNAVQAMRDGGTLMVRARLQRNAVSIEVADSGPGIEKSVRAQLFEPFFTTREKGSGLGLAVVSQTVADNGGHLELESEEGRGTVFKVVLPARAGSDS
jgi:signal transduction histidine kinase